METQLTPLLQLKCSNNPLLLCHREAEQKIQERHKHSDTLGITYTHLHTQSEYDHIKSLTDALSVQYKDMSTTDML